MRDFYGEITWSGRIFVSGDHISEEEYNAFFSTNDQYGIKLEVANLILADNAKGEYSEVVPADELQKEVREEIKYQILCLGLLNGSITKGRETLTWAWDPDFHDGEGTTVAFEDVPLSVLGKVADDILDHECYCGIVDL